MTNEKEFLDKVLQMGYENNSNPISSKTDNITFASLTEMYQVGEGVFGDFCSDNLAKFVYGKRCSNNSEYHYTFPTITEFATYERTVFNKVKNEFILIEDTFLIEDNLNSVIQFKESLFSNKFKSDDKEFCVGISYGDTDATNIDEPTVDVIIFTPYWYVLDMYPIPVKEIKQYINKMVVEYAIKE